MGRGLSELQKAILRRALSNREREGRDDHSELVDVYSCEIAADHFGWPLPSTFYMDGERLNAWICERPKDVTPAEGNCVHAAISRALRRLEGRGLGESACGAYRPWSGFRLNARGVEIARGLSVNPSAVLPKD